MVLQVLQVLGNAHRAGYLTSDELVICLVCCGNRFAEQGNGDFFREYVRYMPDINRIQDVGRMRFTMLCKSYYFAYKHVESALDQLQTECMLIDTEELTDWFRNFIIDKKINDLRQLQPLFDRAKTHGETITNEDFKQMCKGHVVPVVMRSGVS
jgi:hypothetical protein